MTAKTFTLTIPGKPDPIRAGAPCKSRHGHVYLLSNEKSNKEKYRISQLVEARVAEMGGFEPFTGAIVAHTKYYFEKPKHKIRKCSNPFPFMDCKPDYDNLIKVTMDGIQRANGARKDPDKVAVVWQDDAQVLGGAPIKLWCVDGEEARTEIVLVEVKCIDVMDLYVSMLDEACDVLIGGVA